MDIIPSTVCIHNLPFTQLKELVIPCMYTKLLREFFFILFEKAKRNRLKFISIIQNLSLFFRSIYFPFPIHFRQFKAYTHTYSLSSSINCVNANETIPFHKKKKKSGKLFVSQNLFDHIRSRNCFLRTHIPEYCL